MIKTSYLPSYLTTETEPVSKTLVLKTTYDEQCPEIKIIFFMTTPYSKTFIFNFSMVLV